MSERQEEYQLPGRDPAEEEERETYSDPDLGTDDEGEEWEDDDEEWEDEEDEDLGPGEEDEDDWQDDEDED